MEPRAAKVKHNLTPGDIDKLSQRIRYMFMKKSGRTFDIEDAVQSILLSMIERPGGATIDQRIIDHLRIESGNKRSGCYEKRKALFWADGIEEHEPFLSTEKGMDKIFDSIQIAKYIQYIRDSTDRAVVNLFVNWGMNFKEIGDVFGFSESRAHQRFSAGVRAIRSKIDVNEHHKDAAK